MALQFYSKVIMYKQLPTTRALSQALKPSKKMSGTAKFNRILTITMICGVIAIAIAWLSIEWNWTSKKVTGYAAISSLGIIFIAWSISILIDLIQSIGMFSNPSGELADQFDNDVEIEHQLISKFRAIPPHILLSRHHRLELQLSVWEKWLDTARLMGLLGPPLIFMGKEYLGTLGTMRVETMIAATLTGVLIGAILMRSGMRRLQRVSYLLKRASERSSYHPVERKRRVKR